MLILDVKMQWSSTHQMLHECFTIIYSVQMDSLIFVFSRLTIANQLKPLFYIIKIFSLSSLMKTNGVLLCW